MPKASQDGQSHGGKVPTAGGPLLSYDVPQQVSYSCPNYIELRFDARDFLATARVAAQTAPEGQS